MRRTRITSLEIRNVSHAFEAGHDLLRGICLNIPLGEVFTVEGTPGSGKSILLKIMAGIITPTGGDVHYNGLALKDLSFEEFNPLRSSTSFCFENGGLFMNKTLLENVKLPLLYHNQWRHERSQQLLDELIEHFEIQPFLHLRPASLSAGVRKIAGLVRGFLSNGQVLFFDEPSLGIGEAGLKALHFWLEKHRKESKHDDMIVVASSDTKFLQAIGGHRYKIDHGRLTAINGDVKGVA